MSVSTRRKVLLYNPSDDFFTMPLALLAVASALDRSRFEPVIVDARMSGDPSRELRDHLDDAICLGITVLTGAPLADALRVSHAVKADRPDLPVIWGGWHPSIFGNECVTESPVDISVQGQGELTFADLVERLAAGVGPAECTGIAHKTGGQAQRNPARAFEDINHFAPLDFSLIPVEDYFARKGRRQLDYIASQGCHFRCSFCADPFVYRRRWSGYTPARIGEEIEELWSQYRFEDVNFQDETFFTGAKRVAEIAEQFVQRELPITWAATMRADQGARLDDEIFALCKRSGLRRVLVGVESGSSEVLKRIKKDVTLDQVFTTAGKCREHGIAVHFPFIVGFPGESPEQVDASLKVVRDLSAMSETFSTPIFYFKPYPGTELTDQVVQSGFELPSGLERWSDFDFVFGGPGPWVPDVIRNRVEAFKDEHPRTRVASAA